MRPAALLLFVALFAAATCSARTEFVVDVGGHPDDFLALAAILKFTPAAGAESIPVRHVTVHGNSAASLSAAVENVREFIGLMGRSDVNVYAGAAQAWTELPERWNANASNIAGTTTSTPTTRTSAQMPTCFQSKAIAPFAPDSVEGTFEAPPSFGQNVYTRYAMDTLFGAADALPATQPIAVLTALEAMKQLLQTSQVDIAYIALGSLTNLAELMKEAQAMNQLRHITAIYINGGVEGAGSGDLSKWLSNWQDGWGGLDPKTASLSWNFFVDPVAANFVLTMDIGLSPSRVVFPLDATESIKTLYAGPEFGALTTNAMKAAATLRARRTPQTDKDAAVLEFLAALTQSHQAFVSAAASSGNFDATYYRPVQAYVALAAVDSRTSGLYWTKTYNKTTVDRSGRMTLKRPASSPMGDDSTVVHGVVPGAPAQFWNQLFTSLGVTRS
jgi:inosine-uridine nucleoside N-ribohydrolase